MKAESTADLACPEDPRHRRKLPQTVNAGEKVHQWAGVKMHQLEGQRESWFGFRQGEREGDRPLAIAANI